MVTKLDKAPPRKSRVVPFRPRFDLNRGPGLCGPEYKQRVRRIYDGVGGMWLPITSILSLRQPMVGWLLRKGRINVEGCCHILDVGCGTGQVLGHLVKAASKDAMLFGCDLSESVLRRACRRVKDARPRYIAADITHLPFPDGSFDCITSGWVLEYLADPRPGLAELARVLKPGGRVLIMATEDSLWGAMVGFFWHCRTYNRKELRAACEQVGLVWNREIWYSPVHRLLRIGGIFVETLKPNGQGYSWACSSTKGSKSLNPTV